MARDLHDLLTRSVQIQPDPSPAAVEPDPAIST
jgi:hypothetical protein